MKKILNAFIILISFVWLVGCDSNNAIFDKYMVNGEDFLIGNLDSFKYYGGDQRAKLVVWARDFRATNLKVSRADTNIIYNFLLSPTNRKDSMVYYINSLKEGTNVLAMKTWNADSTVHSIPMGFTVTSWGNRYKSFLKNRMVMRNNFNLFTGVFTITWSTSNVIEPTFGKYALGHEIKYTNTEGVEVLVRDLYTNLVAPTITTPLLKYPTSGGSYSYRMLYLPATTSIDTFRTAYTTITAP
jgi:hypothetical protein